ncbi:MAG: ribosome maturation factor RimP [Betaproteobacteria bacterium]
MAKQPRPLRSIASAQPARLSLVVLRRLAEEALLPWGYELVDLEVAAGLIRIFIDWPADLRRSITIDDCENVSRQLGQLLMVADLDYRRLEVSSPGLDRPLKSLRDFERFQGCQVRVRLRELLKGRRQWEGTLVPVSSLGAEFLASMPDAQRPQDSEGPEPGNESKRWALVLNAGSPPAHKPAHAGARPGKTPGRKGETPGRKGKAPGHKGKAPGVVGLEAPADPSEAVMPMALCFRLDELESARLVPQLEF